MASTGSGTGEQKDADAAPPPCSKNISAPLPPAAASSPGAAVHLVLSRLSGDSWLLPLGDSSEAELVSVGDAKSMLSRESENPHSGVLQPGRESNAEGSSGGGGVAPFPASMVALLHAETLDELDDAVLLSKVDYSARMIFLGAEEWLSRCPGLGFKPAPSWQLVTPLQQVWSRVITAYDPYARQQLWDPAWTVEQKRSARQSILKGALFLLDDAAYRTLVTTSSLPPDVHAALSHLPPDVDAALRRQPALYDVNNTSRPTYLLRTSPLQHGRPTYLTHTFFFSALRCGLSRLPAMDFLSAARHMVRILCYRHVNYCFWQLGWESVCSEPMGYCLSTSEIRTIWRGSADRLEMRLMYLSDLIYRHPQLEHRRTEIERELLQLVSEELRRPRLDQWDRSTVSGYVSNCDSSAAYPVLAAKWREVPHEGQLRGFNFIDDERSMAVELPPYDDDDVDYDEDDGNLTYSSGELAIYDYQEASDAAYGVKFKMKAVAAKKKMEDREEAAAAAAAVRPKEDRAQP
mmetsp:Transcript_18844/g.47118  ORF Transcript_18844/g.47118 Transcript_18844/m.47118 type:complete len:519 (-) Transcript_18844:524-2080(-)|eukprot:CAMPEP_0178994268 /NCGR_PEP_ID=MMETSP0795-20121207/7180_1 /TAXON_ID=88552 /ORGANISM="Amoebophrya sp., Strain Ameob2" /LENGTH=518 /DNA_ID=CAMNT_0020686451 /DNA_START=140 /DNA_END=1696 /DNA_ORIENTATION=+